MISLLILIGSAGYVLGQAAQYPPGVDPRLCPNFPQCDNAILAAFAKYNLPGLDQKPARSPGHGAGGRGAGAGAGYDNIKIDHFLLTPPGYPVGLGRDQCPNYPFCK